MTCRRLYSITEEPMKCPDCQVIMKISQAADEPDDDGRILCSYCNKPLEQCVNDD